MARKLRTEQVGGGHRGTLAYFGRPRFARPRIGVFRTSGGGHVGKLVRIRFMQHGRGLYAVNEINVPTRRRTLIASKVSGVLIARVPVHSVHSTADEAAAGNPPQITQIRIGYSSPPLFDVYPR